MPPLQGSSSTSPSTVVLLLAAAASLSPFGMAIAVPSLPTIGERFAADPALTQFLVSAYLIGLGLAQPLQGPLCDRFGRRRMLLVSFSFSALASGLAALAPALVPLIVCRFLQAVGLSAATVVARAVVRDLLEGRAAASAIAWITTAMGLAPLLAPPLGGWLDETVGWRATFVAAGLLVLVVVGWAARALPETLPATARQPLDLAQVMRNWRTLAVSRQFLGFTFIFASANAAFFAFLAIAPIYFAERLGIGPGRFGLYWSGLAGAYLLGAVLTAQLTPRLGVARLLRWGVGLGAVSAFVLVVSTMVTGPGVVAILAPMAGLTLSFGFTHPLALARAVDPFPGFAGTASGLTSALAMAASALMTAVVGALYDGTAVALVGGVVVAMAVSVLAYLLLPRASFARR